MGNDKKQTAVDWLFMMMHSIGMANDENNKKILLKAKQMEREQMINFYGQGVADTYGEITDATKDANQYYELFYGTTN